MPPTLAPKSRPWSRRLLPVLLFLALGLLTTLALAWPIPVALIHYGIILHDRSPPRRPWTSPSGIACGVTRSRLALSDWVVIRPVQPEDSFLPMGEPAAVPSWAAIPAISDGRVRQIDTGATGWPFRAMASESWQFFERGGFPGGGQVREDLHHNLVLFTTSRGRTILPLRPIWLGLLADVVVYSFSWWLVVASLAAGRRMFRRRRGRCTDCGYDLRSTPPEQPCPECGLAHAPR